MNEIRAQISHVVKHRNAQEWRTVPTITAEGITVEGDGLLMPKLAQALIDAGKPPIQPLSAYRGDMRCLNAATLAEWALNSAFKAEQPEQLRKA